MNRKLAATAVILTRLNACLPFCLSASDLPACMPACLRACLICRGPRGCRRAENTVEKDQLELASKTKVCVCGVGGCYSDFWLLQGLGLWTEGGRGTLPCLQKLELFMLLVYNLKFRHGRARPVERTCPL